MTTNRQARIAGAFYVITILGSLVGLVDKSLSAAGLTIAGIAYIAVTILFYFLFRPADSLLSGVAAATSGAGILAGPVAQALSIPNDFAISMVFFGVYCILIGILVRRTVFLPRLLGTALAVGGVVYIMNSLTIFIAPDIAHRLSFYPILPGFLAETTLCIWLLIYGTGYRRAEPIAT
jgi:hypothetical protein